MFKMNTKVITVFCIMVYATKAFPQYPKLSANMIAEKIEKLGLSPEESVDYNAYILNLEAVIEKGQQVALKAIENTLDVVQESTKDLAREGAQQNVHEISDIQSIYFKLFEDLRHKAFLQNIDISSCVYPVVQLMHTESQTSIRQITNKMDNITEIFNNYTSVDYVTPARASLATSYTIRERIYRCPFSFTDFTPFYLCLTVAAVLEDVVLLNQFAVDFNDTSVKVHGLVQEFQEAVKIFRNENVVAFNATAQSLYSDVFVPCAALHGFSV